MAKRKRGTSPAAAAGKKTRLLPGDNVEVLSYEPGLRGSWHGAFVTGVSGRYLTVRYNDFVAENGTPLVETIEVSNVIDGKPSLPPGSFTATRANVRPMRPHQPLQVFDAKYGLCVDALLDGSYWEGVITDHAQGSTERKVFFPDEGDDRTMVVNQLRPTQDWDEITGKWKPRGIWLFLQVLLLHEEKDGLPVSVRQIWYDLRSNPSFGSADAKLWMSGTDVFWERLVAAIIADLWSVCGRPPQDGNQNKEVEPIVFDERDTTPAALLEYIAYYRSGNRVGANAKKKSAMHYLKSLGWTFVEDRIKNKYYISPEGKRLPSFLGACEASLEQKESENDCQHGHTDNLLVRGVAWKTEHHSPSVIDLSLVENKSNSRLSTDASTTWGPVQLKAKYSSKIKSLLSNYSKGTAFHHKGMRVPGMKQHLLALGWGIDFKVDQVIPNGRETGIKRYRYKSPDEKIYYKIFDVLENLAASGEDVVVTSPQRNSKKRKSSSDSKSRARVLSSRHGPILSCQVREKTLLSLLLDKNILKPRDRITYKKTSDEPAIKEGLITRDMIKCSCCDQVFTLESFEAHAGSRTGLPSAHIFLKKDETSLSQCLVELMGENRPNNRLRVRLKKTCPDVESDSICSICNEGGEILLCDNCPSSFHHVCVGLEATPEGSWYCPSCRCSICDSSDYDPDTNQFTKKTMMYCDQCEREYHVGCVRNKGDELTCCPEGCWFCSRECSQIFQNLQGLVGKSISTHVEGLSCTILRFHRENGSDHGDYDNETMAERYGKLCIALDVIHECFVTIIEPRTQSDLSKDILFNRESELRRLNFRGFYTILLEKDGELISVGTFRVCGRKFAELPLVGTRVQYRQQGMCRLLMNELEKLLSGLGVERLLLPAVPQLLQTWTRSFGFTAMSFPDRFELAESSVLSFQGTSMCQKILSVAHHDAKDLCSQVVPYSGRIQSVENTTFSSKIAAICDKVVNNASNSSEELKAFTVTTSNRLELVDNAVLSNQGTTLCQRVSFTAFGPREELNGLDHQLECTRTVRETMRSNSQEHTPMMLENTDQMEPMLLLDIGSSSDEQGRCAVDVPPTSTPPDTQVSFTGDKHERPYGGVGSDQCSENSVLAEVKPAAENTVPRFKVRFSGKCYQRVAKGSSRRKLGMPV